MCFLQRTYVVISSTLGLHSITHVCTANKCTVFTYETARPSCMTSGVETESLNMAKDCLAPVEGTSTHVDFRHDVLDSLADGCLEVADNSLLIPAVGHGVADHLEHSSVMNASSSRHYDERHRHLFDDVIHTHERVDATQLDEWSAHHIERAVHVPTVRTT